MTVFPARFSSKCPACGEQISVNDPVTWREEQVVHEGCRRVVGSRVLRVNNETCSRCFQTKAVSGACGCDE